MIKPIRFSTVVMSIALSPICSAWAGSGAGAVNDVTGTGLSGYDAVSYFEGNGPVQGIPRYTSTYQGVDYLFASAEHRDAFNADPGRYTPQFGGFCAIAAANGMKVTIDPHAYTVIGKKLYVNHSMAALEAFVKDTAGNIDKAEKNWPVVRAIDGPTR
jgi:hypothetical protein